MSIELKNKYGADEERESMCEVFFAGFEESETGVKIKYETEFGFSDECENDEERLTAILLCDTLAQHLEGTVKHLREHTKTLKEELHNELD